MDDSTTKGTVSERTDLPEEQKLEPVKDVPKKEQMAGEYYLEFAIQNKIGNEWSGIIYVGYLSDPKAFKKAFLKDIPAKNAVMESLHKNPSGGFVPDSIHFIHENDCTETKQISAMDSPEALEELRQRMAGKPIDAKPWDFQTEGKTEEIAGFEVGPPVTSVASRLEKSTGAVIIEKMTSIDNKLGKIVESNQVIADNTGALLERFFDEVSVEDSQKRHHEECEKLGEWMKKHKDSLPSSGKQGNDTWASSSEAAELLGITSDTLTKYIRNHVIKDGVSGVEAVAVLGGEFKSLVAAKRSGNPLFLFFEKRRKRARMPPWTQGIFVNVLADSQTERSFRMDGNKDFEMMDTQQAAEFLGVSKRQIAYLRTNASLPWFSLGGRVKFAKSRLLEWLKSQEKTGIGPACYAGMDKAEK